MLVNFSTITGEVQCKAAYGIHLQQLVEAEVPGAKEVLLQRLAAGTEQDEDAYLLKRHKRLVHMLPTECRRSSLILSAHLIWFALYRLQAAGNAPNARDDSPVTKRSRQAKQLVQKGSQHARPSTSSSAEKPRPNPQLFAYSLDHTKQTYAPRFHALKAARDLGNSIEASVLQPLAVGAVPPPHTVKGVHTLVSEGRLSVPQLQLHPSGQYVLHPDVLSSIPQKGRLWLLLRIGCVTGSSWHVFLGFHEDSKPYLVPKDRRGHQHVLDAAHRLQSDAIESRDDRTAFMFSWGHMHEPNAYESVLHRYPSVHIHEQPLIQLWSLPPELQGAVSLSDLPLLGAPPDGLLDGDPAMLDSTNASVLELKAKVPFSFCKRQWRFIDDSKPSTDIDCAHYAQVQLEMLVTGKQQAYLVYWACTVTHTFRVVLDVEWLTMALTLLQEVNVQFLRQGMSPSEEFYSSEAATDLRSLTKKRIKRISKDMTQSESMLNHDSSVANKFLD